MFGGEIKGTIQDITPTFLTQGVLNTLRQADYVANRVLLKTGGCSWVIVSVVLTVAHWLGSPPEITVQCYLSL